MKRLNEARKEFYRLSGVERKNNFLSEMMGIKMNNSPMRSLNDEGVMKLLTSNITQGYIIVSADDNVGNNSQTVDGNRIREIRNDIKDSRFLYIPIFGKYEDANDESAEIYKSSFAIMNRKEKGEIPSFNELIELGESLTKKYGQEGFIIHETNKRPTYVNSAGQRLYNFDVSENIAENINETIKYFFEKKIIQDQENLHEINLDRLIKKHGEAGYIVISASRSENSREKNNIQTKNLENDLRNSEYSYKAVYGGYIETNQESGENVDVFEDSFVVFNFDRKGALGEFHNLFNFGIELVKKYQQESFLAKAPGKGPKYVDGNGRVNHAFSDEYVINDLSEKYFTSLIKTKKMNKDQSKVRKSRITFKEAFLNPLPATYNGRVMRGMGREIF